jgi:hypothetical protein
MLIEETDKLYGIDEPITKHGEIRRADGEKHAKEIKNGDDENREGEVKGEVKENQKTPHYLRQVCT